MCAPDATPTYFWAEGARVAARCGAHIHAARLVTCSTTFLPPAGAACASALGSCLPPSSNTLDCRRGFSVPRHRPCCSLQSRPRGIALHTHTHTYIHSHTRLLPNARDSTIHCCPRFLLPAPLLFPAGGPCNPHPQPAGAEHAHYPLTRTLCARLWKPPRPRHALHPHAPAAAPISWRRRQRCSSGWAPAVGRGACCSKLLVTRLRSCRWQQLLLDYIALILAAANAAYPHCKSHLVPGSCRKTRDAHYSRLLLCYQYSLAAGMMTDRSAHSHHIAGIRIQRTLL